MLSGGFPILSPDLQVSFAEVLEKRKCPARLRGLARFVALEAAVRDLRAPLRKGAVSPVTGFFLLGGSVERQPELVEGIFADPERARAYGRRCLILARGTYKSVNVVRKKT